MENKNAMKRQVQLSLFPDQDTMLINDVWEEDKKDQKRIEALIQDNLKLVGFCMKRINGITSANTDDVYQAGMIALWMAAKSYNSSRMKRFSTYATTCIVRAMYGEVYSCLKDQRKSLFSLNNDDELLDSKLMNILQITDKDTLSALNAQDLMDLIQKVEKNRVLLNEKKGVQALRLSFLGYSNDEIAEKIGIQKDSVRSMMTIGRRVLLAHPLIREYVSGIKNTEEKSDHYVVDLMGEKFQLIFSRDLIFDVSAKPREYEEHLCELLSRPNVAQWLLDNVRIDDSTAIYDAETKRTTVLTMHADSIEVSFAAQPHTIKKSA